MSTVWLLGSFMEVTVSKLRFQLFSPYYLTKGCTIVCSSVKKISIKDGVHWLAVIFYNITFILANIFFSNMHNFEQFPERLHSTVTVILLLVMAASSFAMILFGRALRCLTPKKSEEFFQLVSLKSPQ